MVDTNVEFVAYQGEDYKWDSQIQETKIEEKVEKEAKPSEKVNQGTFQGTQEARTWIRRRGGWGYWGNNS
mgnify:CR=1 FL=1